MSARTGCCGWNMAKLDPRTGEVIWKARIVGQNPNGDASDLVCELEPLNGTNDMLAIVVKYILPGDPDESTYTLCRVDSTGAVVWSYPTGWGTFARCRTFASDGTNVYVRTATGIQALDYSGNPLWFNTVRFQRSFMSLFTVWTQPGQTSVVVYQDNGGGPIGGGVTEPGFFISSFDGPSGRLISTFKPTPNPSGHILFQSANYGDFYMPSDTILQSIAGAINPSVTPYTPDGMLLPPDVSTIRFERCRTSVAGGTLLITDEGSGVMGVRNPPPPPLGTPTLPLPGLTSIPGSSSPTFTPNDVEPLHNFGINVIGCNSQTRSSLADPFNVVAMRFLNDPSPFWIGPQVGKGSPFTTDNDPFCYAVSADRPVLTWYGNWIYVGGFAGNG